MLNLKINYRQTIINSVTTGNIMTNIDMLLKVQFVYGKKHELIVTLRQDVMDEQMTFSHRNACRKPFQKIDNSPEF